MRTILISREHGLGNMVRRILRVPYTGERVLVQAPRYLARDNAYRQGATFTGVRPAWDARAMGLAGLYAESATAELRDLGAEE